MLSGAARAQRLMRSPLGGSTRCSSPRPLVKMNHLPRPTNEKARRLHGRSFAHYWKNASRSSSFRIYMNLRMVFIAKKWTTPFSCGLIGKPMENELLNYSKENHWKPAMAKICIIGYSEHALLTLPKRGGRNSAGTYTCEAAPHEEGVKKMGPHR